MYISFVIIPVTFIIFCHIRSCFLTPGKFCRAAVNVTVTLLSTPALSFQLSHYSLVCFSVCVFLIRFGSPAHSGFRSSIDRWPIFISSYFHFSLISCPPLSSLSQMVPFTILIRVDILHGYLCNYGDTVNSIKFSFIKKKKKGNQFP